MKEFVGKGWERILKLNTIDSFDSLWELDATWFEEPNERRGGWSGVSKIDLKTENGELVPVFLKRQENHDTKVWNSPFKGIPTFYKEFKNIQRFIGYGIPTVEPVYFGFRHVNGKSQAILITKSLEGFESLDSALYAREGELMSNRVLREALMETVAGAMRGMHQHHLQHRCLYGKHIFVRLVNSNWEVRFIDLEKLKRRLFYKQAVLGDLYTLPRRMPGWRLRDKLNFFKIYMQEEKLSPRSKLIWREIHNKMKAKNKF